MTIPGLHDIFPRVLLPPVTALFLVTVILIASCSNSEQRLPAGDTMSKVIINIGGSDASGGSRMAGMAPSNITSVSVTVTGAGMTPMSVTDTVLAGTIELSVPAGPSRLFAVVVTTIDAVYSGTAVASLPAGTTVSVPIVMEYGGLFGLSNEGSIENPVLISLDENTYTSTWMGTVGKGISYYSVVDPGSHTFLNISITALTDDADLISYAGDSNFYEMLSPNFGQNYCGRTHDEAVSASSFSSPYYFVVDGRHTKTGARFMITCIAHDGMKIGNPPMGTILNPNIVPVGLPYSSAVSMAEPINYYVSLVKAGTQYWINGYDFDSSSQIFAYDSAAFTTPINPPITSTGNIIGFTASESVSTTDNFTLEVVANEGTDTNPIKLYASDIFDIERTNYCMVGGGYGNSYYRVPISTYDFYAIGLTDIKNDIDLTVYSGPSFSSPEEIGLSTNSGTESEAVTLPINDGDLPDGNLYIKVSDNNGAGSTFILNVMNTISIY